MSEPPTYKELYDACFVPGSWTCPECGFILQKSTLSVSHGEIGTSETDRQSEPCPNDGEWMLPTTYQHVARSLHERLMQEFEQRDKSNARSQSAAHSPAPDAHVPADTNPSDTSAMPDAVTVHELKTWPGPFKAIRDGSKAFEYRKQDRKYKVGDVLALFEWTPTLDEAFAREWLINNAGETLEGEYSGESETRVVSYIIEGGCFGVPEGFCVLSLARSQSAPQDQAVAEPTQATPEKQDDSASLRIKEKEEEKFLFLDVDGVLNDHTKLPNGYSQMGLDKVALLTSILEAVPECRIIVTSAWRYAFDTPDSFGNVLCLFGMPYDIASRVESVTLTDEEMCHELGLAESCCSGILDYEWLKENGHLLRREQVLTYLSEPPETFVVLDDLDLEMPELVKTDGDVGLTREIADEVIRRLSCKTVPLQGHEVKEGGK